MLSQMALNTGAQDGLLIDNSKSYFTSTGYVRSSNFQMELRDVEPQNTPNLGGTATFIIPKAADLLGSLDLMVHFDTLADGALTGLPDSTFVGWVESLGFAMIEKLDFQVGSHSIEVLTGEDLNIMNELMRGETSRAGFHQILKTGRPLVSGSIPTGATEVDYVYDEDTSWECHDRLLGYVDKYGVKVRKEGKRLVIPLSLMFTTHPSKYLPLAAIANCNDIRVVIKFRSWQELIMVHHLPAPVAGTFSTAAGTSANLSTLSFAGASAFKALSETGEPQKGACTLRCQYIHLTGPEATALMGKEHVRMMKKWDQNRISEQKVVAHEPAGRTFNWSIPLNFLHPVQMIIITLRKVEEAVSSSTQGGEPVVSDSSSSLPSQLARSKNYFAYHGGKEDPNIENATSCINETLATASGTATDSSGHLTVTEGAGFAAGMVVEIRGGSGKRPDISSAEVTHKSKYWVKSYSAAVLQLIAQDGTNTASSTATTFDASQSGLAFDIVQISGKPDVPMLDVTNFKITINGHTRHLDGKGLDKQYLCNKMMPAMHPNQTEFYKQLSGGSSQSSSDSGHHAVMDYMHLQQYKDRKDIFVYPFAMNPQSENPSGHVNFSKVSHSTLDIMCMAYGPEVNQIYQVDVIGLYYNWAAIKDGRMLVSFA